MHIKIKQGLDIPIAGKPMGNPQETLNVEKPTHLSLNLDPFDDIHFKLLAKVGDSLKIGQPLAEDKNCEGRAFTSPAAGVITEIRRGLKRRILDIVIKVDSNEQYYSHTPLNPDLASRDEIIDALKKGGLFAQIRARPFNRLADPHKPPRNIFVKGVESAPFVPPAEFQVAGHEEAFQIGLNALSKLTDGKVHLVYNKNTTCAPFLNAKNVERHTVEGPHPVSNHSLHIQEIDPVKDFEDTIWTLNAHDVVCIGELLSTGKMHIHKVIGIGGPGILPDKTGYFTVRSGFPIEKLIDNRIKEGTIRLISGDPLMGKKVQPTDYLGYAHFAFSAIPETDKREMLHFFRFGKEKYSASKAYVSGHLSKIGRLFNFTTSMHGEKRAFIDGSLYDKVMPLNISTMTLVKSVMARDFDRAHELGLLDVDSEDFALPTFVCPSKIEMIEIIKQGLRANVAEIFGS